MIRFGAPRFTPDIRSTLQNLYDRMVRGMRSQQFVKAMRTDGHGCSYLNSAGLRCPVGHLLSIGPGHELMSPMTTVQSVKEVWLGEAGDHAAYATARALHFAGVPSNDDVWRLLAQMQSAHDGSGDSDMKERFRQVAINLGLDYMRELPPE